jgi:hypothetical protein
MAKIGYIYKIVCSDVNVKQIYVGSTRDMRQRKSQHKHACDKETNKNYNLYLYKFIRDNGRWENWAMVQIEQYKYNTKPELHARERHFIETLHAELNKVVPTRTDHEYYEENKEKISGYRKLYYVENKEEMAEKSKLYYEENKEEIKQKHSEKIACACGKAITKGSKSRHQKTAFHISNSGEEIQTASI